MIKQVVGCIVFVQDSDIDIVVQENFVFVIVYWCVCDMLVNFFGYQGGCIQIGMFQDYQKFFVVLVINYVVVV